jgi:hypothetical protein
MQSANAICTSNETRSSSGYRETDSCISHCAEGRRIPGQWEAHGFCSKWLRGRNECGKCSTEKESQTSVGCVVKPAGYGEAASVVHVVPPQRLKLLIHSLNSQAHGKTRAEQSQHYKLRDFLFIRQKNRAKTTGFRSQHLARKLARVNGLCRALSSRVSQLISVRDTSKNWKSLGRGFLRPSMSSEYEHTVRIFEPHPFRLNQHLAPSEIPFHPPCFTIGIGGSL